MNRPEVIARLVAEEDRINEEFMAQQVDRDTWTKTLELIDERLAIAGMRLAFRPWEGTTAVPKSPKF